MKIKANITGMMLAALMAAGPACGGITVDCDMPAGNIIVDGIEGDTVKVRQDLRDSNMWFYWAFRVRGAAGRTLKFEFTEKTWGGPVGVRGPVVSADGGKTFSYPLDGKSRTDGFAYSFGAGEDDVLFYECHPYVRANWDAFVAKHAAAIGKKFVVETLCKSRKGADVPRARFGCIASEPKFRIFMSARHHCSETMASWVLEGVGEAFLADDDLGRWLCGNVELMMVPFVDYDGAQAGDQGKVRRPHDHNRDYTEFIYPETKAITEWIAEHAGGKLDMFIDVHCPWVRGKYNEWLYTPWKDPKILPDVAAEHRFSALLEKLQCGTMRYRAADDLPFGKEWNNGVNYAQGWSGVIWACHKVRGLKIARSYEVPFANANGAVVTPETCRDLGHDTAKVFRAMLDEPADTVWLEAESFEDWGGWVNDTQFMDQMGSPYLLAHGLGKPVADAKTTFVAKVGKYNVWVRTRNWTAYWHPGWRLYPGAGTFNIVVNGEKLPNVIGGRGDGKWEWIKAGEVTLKVGENTVALHDLDGFDGRVDAIVFSTKGPSEFTSRDSLLRDSVGKTMPPYDVVVVGGGIAGICAAISSARLGLKTALIHDRPVLGGNNSSEVRVHLGAYANLPPYPRLGDVVAEIGPKSGGNAREASVYEDDRKMKVVKETKGLDLYLNQHVNRVCKDDEGRILAVGSQDTRNGDRYMFKGSWFVDCTGDGSVGYRAGADWRMGREAKGETNEPDAPEKADMITMGASVQWYAGEGERGKGEWGAADAKAMAVESGNGGDFPVRPWMLKTVNEANCSPHLRGDWWWEAGLGRDQIKEGEYIRDYGLLVAFSNWAFVKNGYSKKEAFADKELKWVAYNAGRRESRRLLGDFILDQNHLRARDFQPDGTCATTWTIDLHLPKTASESKFEGEPYQSNSLNEKIWPYPIPYRCLYSRNVPNLFMAGRDISVTHIALGTTRLMRTHGMMGEVVGMAASICKKHNCDPRDVYKSHFNELKALMEKGVGDGKKHPRQDYNCQSSLDPDIKAHHAESVKGHVE